MKLDFVKNTKRNMAANALNSGIRLVFPFLNRTLFLWLLGPAYLGLNGLFGSILGVLMLAELGFGTAVVCSMYKPVADDDRELLCAYLNFYRKVYRCVGAAIFAIGLCLLPFLGRLVHGNIPSDIDLHVLYVIHLVNTATSYFLFAYRGVVLGAHHRNDVVTNIRTAVSVVQYIVVFLILLLTRNYYHYVLATVLFTVVQNVLLVHASRRLFPDIEPRGTLDPALRRRVISDVKSIFLHKVGGVVSYSMDNIVISAFLGLVAVAAYGNYYYVVTAVSSLAAIVHSSMTGGFGNKIYTVSKEENFALFMRMCQLVAVIVIWCAAMMAALYQPFIVLWTKDNTHLIRHALTPILMILYFYVQQARQMLLSFKSAASLWRQDRWKPIVAGVVNLGLSFVFVKVLPEEYKLDGVIAATIIGFVFIQAPWESWVVFTSFFNGRQAREYLRVQAFYAACALALCTATWGATKTISLEGAKGLLAKSCVAILVATGALAILFGQSFLKTLKSFRRPR